MGGSGQLRAHAWYIGEIWCRTGSAYIRVIVVCVRESDGRGRYAAAGPRVWSSNRHGSSYRSCAPAYTAINAYAEAQA